MGGRDADLKWAADAKAAGLAGTFVWAINPDAGGAARTAPKLAAASSRRRAGWPALRAAADVLEGRRGGQLAAVRWSRACVSR